MDQWIFAYGSNMHLADLKRWFRESGQSGGDIARSEAATLADYRLVWNYYAVKRHGGGANVEAAPGSVLHGVALLVDAPTLAGIDRKEGYPHVYNRCSVDVALRAGPIVRSYLYQVMPVHRRREFIAPTARYLDLLIQGAREHALPEAHLEGLRRVATCD